MSFNLIESTKSFFTNELISKAASYFGETESGVAKAISATIPSIINGLADKASTQNGAGTITRLAQEYHQSGILNSFENFFNYPDTNLLNKGTGLVSNLFGEGNTTQLSNIISDFSGIKTSTASALSGITLPVILALLGRHAANSSIGATSITTALSHHIGSGFPAGFGLGSLFVNKTNTYSNNKQQVADTDTGKSGIGWLLPLLILALIAVLAWYFFKDGCNKKTADVVTTADSSIVANADSIKNNIAVALGKVDSLTGDFIYNEGDTVTIDLPNNGGKLVIGKNSTEYKLIEFLSDKNAVLDTIKGNWFEFTNVHFKSGTATLTDGSMAQLKNVAVIFKAFPVAEFKLGGYTDSTGDAALNESLSQKRADLVEQTLKKLGAPAASIIDAKGYGKEWPIADNATVEGRAMNRRVAVNVKAK